MLSFPSGWKGKPQNVYMIVLPDKIRPTQILLGERTPSAGSRNLWANPAGNSSSKPYRKVQCKECLCSIWSRLRLTTIHCFDYIRYHTRGVEARSDGPQCFFQVNTTGLYICQALIQYTWESMGAVQQYAIDQKTTPKGSLDSLLVLHIHLTSNISDVCTFFATSFGRPSI